MLKLYCKMETKHKSPCVQTIFFSTFGLACALKACVNMSVKGWVGLVHNIN